MAKIIKITEEQYNMIEANYPKSFNHDEFKSLTSFAARKRYADKHLEKLGAGSGRLVYIIDDETVLKLAKNNKGVAQNKAEIRQWNTNDHVTAKVYEYHKNFLWLEMERARKAKAADFRKIVGLDFKNIADGLLYRHTLHNNRRPPSYYGLSKPENYEEMVENEWYYFLETVMIDYGLEAGDLARMSSYGVVKRDGQEDIVVVDFGYDSNVKDIYYPKN
jgi:hypothetical protein